MQETLQRIATAFGSGTVLSYGPAGGQSSRNFVVMTDTGKLFIKCLRPPFDLEGRSLESVYAARAAEHGIPVPSYLGTCAGGFVYQDDKVTALALPAIAGVPPCFVPAHAREVGRVLASVHKVPHRRLPMKRGWMHLETHWRRIGELRGYAEHRHIRTILEFDRRMSEFRHTVLPDLPITMTHGDAHFGNMLFHEGTDDMAALLDWEDAMVGTALADYCIAITGCCFEDDVFRPDLYAAFAEGYDAVRPLTKGERAALKDCMQHVAIVQTAWRYLAHNVHDFREEHAEDYLRMWRCGLHSWSPPT